MPVRKACERRDREADVNRCLRRSNSFARMRTGLPRSSVSISHLDMTKSICNSCRKADGDSDNIVYLHGHSAPLAQDFLDGALTVADRTARQVATLRVSDDALTTIPARNAERLDRIRVVLENLRQTETDSTRSAAFPPPVALKANRRQGTH